MMTTVHPPNGSFYGRDQALDRLHENLSNTGDICVIHPVGGIGKTFTVVEYVYRSNMNMNVSTGFKPILHLVWQSLMPISLVNLS